MAFQKPVVESKTIPLKILVDKQRNKVAFVETTKDFVDTLFSFLSLPLATIVRLLETNNSNDQQPQQSETSPFLDNMRNLYKSVQHLDSDDVWNNHLCKQVLLRPKNPCESLCTKLFMNIDDTELSNKYFVCLSCYKFTTFQNVNCICTHGSSSIREAWNLDSENQNNAQDGVFVRKNGPMFLISDDLKILPSSMLSSLEMLIQSGHSDLTQLEEITHNIGKHEMLNLLKYTLISHEPLTNTILASSSIKKDIPPNQIPSAVIETPLANDNTRKMVVKVMQSKSQKNIIYAETNGEFVDFIFSFLTMPLGSIVKRLGVNSFAGPIGSLYKSMESFDPTSVFLNPGIVQQFNCPNHPLNIPHVMPRPTTYYYDYKIGGSISKSSRSIVNSVSVVSRDFDMLEGVVGFVKQDALYGVGDDLKVKKVSANFCFSYLKELNLSLDDLEVRAISIGEVEALSLLEACVTSNYFTLTSALKHFLNVPKHESTLR
ncbi:uncharacterized protein LOC131604245 [Vicia villosa]|uniref:uncharacterized protein LOC131604245 n=1 Tax=Vicia villosa TaxID=3911 RepID=UPI00273AED80|nr:uncharacterized protein LOC131604245 [Vicia villosa]